VITREEMDRALSILDEALAEVERGRPAPGPAGPPRRPGDPGRPGGT
jgi:hypothetical protein